jgi:hypothetical protein
MNIPYLLDLKARDAVSATYGSSLRYQHPLQDHSPKSDPSRSGVRAGPKKRTRP